MNVPVRLIKFWYPAALQVFLVSWHNLMNLLEEDLAVGLMLKLLFVPLFHDSSFVGKMLSFCFRMSRILIGLLALALVTVFLTILALLWFAAPLVLIPVLFWSKVLAGILLLIVIFGLALFIHQLMQQTSKKVWHIHDLNDLWQATKLKKEQIVFASLLQDLETQNLLFNLELKQEVFASFNPTLNDQVLQQSLNLAQKAEAEYLTGAYFWVALLFQVPNLEQYLIQFNLQPSDFERALVFLELKRNKWRRYFIWDEEFAVRHLSGTNRGWLSAPTPNLDAVSTDLTKLAATQSFDEFLGRQTVVTQVVNILSQSSDRNVLIVGAPGSGRTALAKHLARLIIAGDAPPALATKRLVELDLTKLLSGVTTEGELAQKVKAAFEEAQFIQDVIIYVDELQNLGIGEAASSFNLYSLLLPYLESNQFQFLSSTDQPSYARIIEKNGSFARLFHKVELPPATIDETIRTMEEKGVDLARQQKITVTFLAIKELVTYANQLIHDRVLPDSAISQLNECQALAKDGVLNSTIVKQALETRVKVPILEIDQSQKQLLLNLEQVIHTRMIDQEIAVKAVADSLRRASTSLREKNRPIGSFLFVGPTGVGKCVTPDTLLFTERGMLSLDNFVPRSNFPEFSSKECLISLYGVNGQEKTSHIYNGGVRKTIHIKTKFGYEIEGTIVHPILIRRKDGRVVFKKLKDIKVGDYVVIQRNQHYFGNNVKILFEFKRSVYDHSSSNAIKIPHRLSMRVARLFGYIVGEATTNLKTAVRFTNKDQQIIEDVRKILNEEFNIKLYHYSSDHAIDYWIHSVKFRSFLAFCGIDYVKSSQKEIPRIILEAPREMVVEYLKGFFEAEGSVNLSGHRVEISSASEKMIKQLHILLLNFGIVANRRKKLDKKLNKTYYFIQIFGENIDIFAKEIGFISRKKKSKLNKLVNRSRNPNVDVIPNLKPQLMALKGRYFQEGFSYGGNAPAYLENWYQRDISYKTLDILLKIHKNINQFPEYNTLDEVRQAHYLYLPVAEIFSGLNQVYDFVVLDTHTFTSNGFISHNTELAKTLASTYFKSEGAFAQFDMSEYQTPEAVGRLIGNAENPGELTELIKNRPYCLLLLDEFEKANPQILTLFLQVLEEGRLTDFSGKQIDFTNTIIISTSNAGSLLIAQGLGSGQTVEQITPLVKSELLKVYKPELVNRFDEVVIFKPLSAADLEKITQLKLAGLQDQLKQQGYLVEFTPEVVAEITKKGYDPVLGARPMRRLIQDKLEANLSKLILAGKLVKGQQLIVSPSLLN